MVPSLVVIVAVDSCGGGQGDGVGGVVIVVVGAVVMVK